MLPISATSLPKPDEKQTHCLKDICLKPPFCALAIWGLQLSLPILPVIAPTTANNTFIKQDLLIYLFFSLLFLLFRYKIGLFPPTPPAENYSLPKKQQLLWAPASAARSWFINISRPCSSLWDVGVSPDHVPPSHDRS